MIKNFSSLFLSFSVINILNRLIPLISIPLLTNNLGLETFGAYTIILAYIILFDTIISFGFKTTAVIDLKLCQNKVKENELFFRIIFSKLLIAIPSFFILLFLLDSLNNNLGELIFAFSILISIVLNQEWYFHGKEKMRSVLVINTLSRLFYLIIIYFYVLSPNDLIYALMAHSTTIFFQNFIITINAIKYFELKWPNSIKIEDCFNGIKSNIYFFSATMSSYFYTSFNLILVDYFYSPLIVGVYSIADKVINVLRDFSNSFNNAILPILAEKDHSGNNGKDAVFTIYILLVFLFFSFVAIVVYFLSEPIFAFFNSDINSNLLGIELMRILVVVLPFSVIIGTISQIYLIRKKSEKLFWIISLISIVSVLSLSVSGYNYSISTFSYTYVFVIILLFSLLAYFIPSKSTQKK